MLLSNRAVMPSHYQAPEDRTVYELLGRVKGCPVLRQGARL